MTVENLTYELKDKKAVEEKLLSQAVEDAKRKANVIALAGGRSLGVMLNANVRYFSSSPQARNYLYAGSDKSVEQKTAQMGAEILDSKVEFLVQVDTVFALMPTKK